MQITVIDVTENTNRVLIVRIQKDLVNEHIVQVVELDRPENVPRVVL